MILDLDHFTTTEAPYWQELETLLQRIELPGNDLSINDARRLHYLYRRASSGLARLNTFADEPETRAHLEALVARAYADIHGARKATVRFNARRWLWAEVPRAFRRRSGAFFAALAAMLLGALFGAAVLVFDPAQKPLLIPPQFGHLYQTPQERVEKEETGEERITADQSTAFAAMLWTNNTRVSIMTLAAGLLFGLGSYLLLFYNGILLGAVAADYVLGGETIFLLGWLLPHGAVELPSIIIAGQAGIVLGGALAGWGDARPMRARLRSVTPDLVTLIFAVAVLLVWAGIVESFFSQYHEPYVPYALKIAFGLAELIALFAYLGLAGRAAKWGGTPHA